MRTHDNYGLRVKDPKTDCGKCTIAIDADLLALLVAERERHLRIMAGVPDGVAGCRTTMKGGIMAQTPQAHRLWCHHLLGDSLTEKGS
jgi:hypothetical protein